MVLLTMTPSIVEGLQTLLGSAARLQEQSLPSREGEPSLDGAAVGNPISHSQIIHLWTALRDAGQKEYTLETLLRGSKVYVPPPPPKPEPVSCVNGYVLFCFSSAEACEMLTCPSRTSIRLSWRAFAGSKSSASTSA